MNKILKNLIIIFVIVCTISTVSFAKNMTNENGAGTVTWNEKKVTDEIKPGSRLLPYELVMGEPLIDIYYGSKISDVRKIYFEFTSGNYNAGNYLIEHNKDKKRIRFTLIGTDNESLRVTSKDGESYIQAAGFTYNLTGIKPYVPFYKVTVEEMFSYKTDGKLGTAKLNTELGNGYITNSESLISNITSYSASYVFSKSNMPFHRAYNLTNEGLRDNSFFNLALLLNTMNNQENLEEIKNIEIIGDTLSQTYTYTLSDALVYNPTEKTVVHSDFGAVKAIYCFDCTSSETLNKKEAGWLERIISKIFISVGDVFVKISGISGAGVFEKATSSNAVVTIDSLIFNEHPNTIVNFFGDTGYTNAKAQKVIEFWFDVFKAWAIIVYIILLIYIGIKTILVSGTSEQKKVKGMLEGWLIRSTFIILYAIFIQILNCNK